jgi:sugar phosphate isomerase/epimerase
MHAQPDPPLSYCTNVHPCRNADDLPAMLDRHAVAVRDACGFEIAVGLWLPAAAARPLASAPGAITDLADHLRRRRLTCHTLNAFPFGDFHGERVKESVYRPDWSDGSRRAYTEHSATVLAGLLDDGVEGSISTLPLGFKGFDHAADFFESAIRHLLEVARTLDRIERDTGRCIRLAIEPEPFCLLETTDETLAFFGRLFETADRAGLGDSARRHLGVCYDVCHQAVEFEDAAAAVDAIHAAGIRINKVQVSCAVEADDPSDPDQRRALAAFVEPRYLHQTTGLVGGDPRSIARLVDLSHEFLASPGPDFLAARPWRVHFHVPVDAERIGPLRTTRADLVRALAAVGRLPYRPHLEVETYTWPVMPGVERAPLAESLARELLATRDLLRPRQAEKKQPAPRQG